MGLVLRACLVVLAMVPVGVARAAPAGAVKHVAGPSEAVPPTTAAPEGGRVGRIAPPGPSTTVLVAAAVIAVLSVALTLFGGALHDRRNRARLEHLPTAVMVVGIQHWRGTMPKPPSPPPPQAAADRDGHEA